MALLFHQADDDDYYYDYGDDEGDDDYYDDEGDDDYGDDDGDDDYEGDNGKGEEFIHIWLFMIYNVCYGQLISHT